MKEKKGLVWSLKHRPPLTISTITAILLLMMTYKEQLIDTLPYTNTEKIAMIGAWYMWGLKLLSSLFAMLSIAIGVKQEPEAQS